MTGCTRALACAILCIAAASCQSVKDPENHYGNGVRSAPEKQVAEKRAEADARGKPATRHGGNGPVTHVVIVWLKKPGDKAARDAIIESAGPLRKIPGVVSVRAGEMVASTRPVVDSTYDVGIVVTFKDQASLIEYARHPIHQKVVEEVIKPHVERYRVYDFQVSP